MCIDVAKKTAPKSITLIDKENKQQVDLCTAIPRYPLCDGLLKLAVHAATDTTTIRQDKTQILLTLAVQAKIDIKNKIAIMRRSKISILNSAFIGEL